MRGGTWDLVISRPQLLFTFWCALGLVVLEVFSGQALVIFLACR